MAGFIAGLEGIVTRVRFSVLDDLVVWTKARGRHGATASTPIPGVARHDGT